MDLPLADGVLLRLLRVEDDFDVFLSLSFSSVVFFVADVLLAFVLLFPPPDVVAPRIRPMIAKAGTTKNNGSDGIAFGLPMAL